MRIFILFFVFCCFDTMAQMNTDIYLCDFIVSENGIHASDPENITKRTGYDNQPMFSYDGKRIYYSANYTGKNDIYVYDIESKKNLTITNTPFTSEFSPMELTDGRSITCVFIEKDTITQRIWKIKMDSRKETVFSPYNDSIGYYWPIEKEWGNDNFEAIGTGFRKVVSEQEYAVFVLGTNETNHTLRIINPYRKLAKEKTIDDSIGRCIRQVPNDHFISYVKKTANGNYLKFYDLYKNQISGNFFLGKENEDYCWSGKLLYFSNGNKIIVVRFDQGYDKPQIYGAYDFTKNGIKNIKRICNFKNKIAIVADDN